MREDGYKQYEPFFGKWRISRPLGSGSFGKVFEIYWDKRPGERYLAALKYIHVPRNEDALREQKERFHNNMAEVRRYFSRQVDRFRDEIRILQNLKGHSNIVSYEDHMIEENPGSDGVGWDILIRMELLHPIQDYFSKPEVTQYDVLCMWLNITNALIFCEDQGIMHRDIKPGNILVSQSGLFKLTDFGVARKSLKSQFAYTMIGTSRYMAPEVKQGTGYDKRADYYSLGCVVYYYLNFKRHILAPPYPQDLQDSDLEEADRRRLGGQKVPAIGWTTAEVNQALLRTVAYDPQARFAGAREMYAAVQMLLVTQEKILKKMPLNQWPPPELPKTHGGTAAGDSNKTGVPWIWFSLAGGLFVAGGIFLAMGLRKSPEPGPEKITMQTSPAIEDQALKEDVETLILSGTAEANTALVIDINGEVTEIPPEENNGTWSYDVEISELHHDDGELNHVSVSYEDGEESAQKVEFFVGEMVTEETSTPVVTPTPVPPTPTPVPPASAPALTPIPIPVVEISTPEPEQTPDIGTPKPTPVPIPVIRSV